MMKTFTVHPLDVWGNEEDGFEVNDVYPSVGTVTIEEDADADAIKDALVAIDAVHSGTPNGYYDDNGSDLDVVFLNVAAKGKPEFMLRLIEPNR